MVFEDVVFDTNTVYLIRKLIFINQTIIIKPYNSYYYETPHPKHRILELPKHTSPMLSAARARTLLDQRVRPPRLLVLRFITSTIIDSITGIITSIIIMRICIISGIFLFILYY